MPVDLLPTPPAAVLFDLDGTLCDSEAGIVAHLAMALETAGFPVPPPDVLRSCVGPPWTEGFPPAVGVPHDRTWDVIDAYRATYDVLAPSLAVPFAGMPEAVAHLAATGVPLAVATSKPQHLADAIVGGGPMAEWLPIVVGAAPDLGRRTKADSVGGALAALGFHEENPPQRAVMVGDRFHDVEGAAAHGLPTVGVAWGSAPPGELEAAGAAAVAASPAELLALLLRAPDLEP